MYTPALLCCLHASFKLLNKANSSLPAAAWPGTCGTGPRDAACGACASVFIMHWECCSPSPCCSYLCMSVCSSPICSKRELPCMQLHRLVCSESAPHMVSNSGSSCRHARCRWHLWLGVAACRATVGLFTLQVCSVVCFGELTSFGCNFGGRCSYMASCGGPKPLRRVFASCRSQTHPQMKLANVLNMRRLREWAGNILWRRRRTRAYRLNGPTAPCACRGDCPQTMHGTRSLTCLLICMLLAR